MKTKFKKLFWSILWTSILQQNNSQQLLEIIKKCSGRFGDLSGYDICYTSSDKFAVKFRVVCYLYILKWLKENQPPHRTAFVAFNAMGIGDTLAFYYGVRVWEKLHGEEACVIALDHLPDKDLVAAIFSSSQFLLICEDFYETVHSLASKGLTAQAENPVMPSRQLEAVTILFCQRLILLAARSYFNRVNPDILTSSLSRWKSQRKSLRTIDPAMAEGFDRVLKEGDFHWFNIQCHNYTSQQWGKDIFNFTKKINGLKQTCPLPKFKSEPYICLHLKLGLGTDTEVRGIESPDSYIPAIQYLLNNNRRVWLMGNKADSLILKESTPDLYALIDDYAGSPEQDIQRDLLAVHGCEFFIGCCSGPTTYCDLFSKPMLRLNATYIAGTEIKGKQMFFPKNFYRTTGELIPWRDLLKSPVIYSNLREVHDANGLVVRDLTAEQILLAVQEFSDYYRSSGTTQPTELQKEFRKSLKPWHFYLHDIECYPCHTYLEWNEALCRN